MKKYWIILLSVILLAILGTGIYLATSSDETPNENDIETGTAIGQLAPDFKGETLRGNPFQLSDLRGRVVIVNVFASWCGPCRLETPHLVKVYQQGEIGVVGINLGEPVEDVAAFKDEFSIPYPLVLDPNGQLTQSVYIPIGLPTSWFLDERGIVRYVFSGAMTKELMERIISDIQAGREPDPFSSQRDLVRTQD